MSQSDLANVLGVTARYLGYLESGQKDIEASSSLYKYFAALETGQIQIDRPLGAAKGNSVREDGPVYNGTSRLPRTTAGLNAADVLTQIRADLAMIEGGAQPEKRRAYHFLQEVHLPMLAKMLHLE